MGLELVADEAVDAAIVAELLLDTVPFIEDEPPTKEVLFIAEACSAVEASDTPATPATVLRTKPWQREPSARKTSMAGMMRLLKPIRRQA